MQFTAVIPSRYDSQRLPAKALIDLAGKPMIQRVYEQVKKSEASRVIVATDDQRISDVVTGFGGEVCVTSASHPSGTDRIQEVSSQLKMTDDEIIVNVQGDEPLIPPAVVNQVAKNLADNDAAMATLYEPILEAADVLDPNIVKVVTDQKGFAMYFSRAPIPWDRDLFPDSVNTGTRQYKRHVGIYAYRVSLLNQYVTWDVDEIELLEKLEQLRVLRAGYKIHIAESLETIPPGIDTEKDLHRTLSILNQEA